jgi:hypothetical protein
VPERRRLNPWKKKRGKQKLWEECHMGVEALPTYETEKKRKSKEKRRTRCGRET